MYQRRKKEIRENPKIYRNYKLNANLKLNYVT